MVRRLASKSPYEVLNISEMMREMISQPYEILKPKVEEQPKDDDDKYEDNTQETKSLPVNNE